MSMPEIPRLPKLLKRRPKPGSSDFSWDDHDYSRGNALKLFVSGDELYASMKEAIGAARETVNLETYIFADDATGREFAALLAEKARQGVRTRLIFDSIGSIDMDPALLTSMRNAGVQTLEYHPVGPWRPRWAWNKRDHRKLLVCDGRVAFTGGMNVSDSNLPKDKGGEGWVDAHVRVEGPAAYDADRLFRAVWFSETGRWFESHGDPRREAGPSRVKVVSNSELLHRFVIREAYVNALRAAKREVCIANSYFIPDWRIRRSLAQAAKRGVSVRVLVPSRSDVQQVTHAARAMYGSLLSRGVRIFEWQGPMLHAKAAVVDRQWCAVGSYNLDRRSLQHNLELNLHAVDEAFGAELAGYFEKGLEGAREITLDEWSRRPWRDRLVQQFWRSFEYLF